MKKLFIIAAVMLHAFTYAFDNIDSALDFVFEYSGDTLWGVNKSMHESYVVGFIENNADVIVNKMTLFEEGDSIGIKLDTLYVPDNHYAFFLAPPLNYSFERISPYLSYMFLSKADSSYSFLNTYGYPENLSIWDEIRTVGRFLKDQAIKDLKDRVDYYTDSLVYDVYIVEGLQDLELIDNFDGIDEETLKTGWIFVIDNHSDTCLTVGYERDLNPNGTIAFSLIPMPIPNASKVDFSSIRGLKLVFSSEINSVLKNRSEIDVSVYPNPAENIISVNIDDCVLTLFSVDGEMLRSSNISQMNISDLFSGTYFLVVTKNDCSVVRKVVKR